MKVDVEGEYGGSPIGLDMVRVRLAKEVKMKDRMIQELTQQQERNEARLTGEMEEKDRQIEELVTDIRTKDGQIATLEGELANKGERMATMEGELANKDERMATMEAELANKDERMATMEGELANNASKIQHQRLQEEQISRLREELRRCQLEGVGKVPLKFPLQLSWRCGHDMPFGMSEYVQSVVAQGRVYVGGGDKIVMEYNTYSSKWACLPAYQECYFGMAVINDQLVIVGGWKRPGRSSGHSSKVLGVWRADSKEWTHPYPEMPTARRRCSAVVYKEWLIVAGGVTSDTKVSSVEVMNTDTKQWHTGQPTPIPWKNMKTAIVGDTCYFMGGSTSAQTGSVYCMSLPALISQVHSQDSRGNGPQIWKEIPLAIRLSAPLSISGSLLAVGGRDLINCNIITAFHLYRPDIGEWVKVGDLPTPRCDCTCAMITDREMLVAGGKVPDKSPRTLDFALITP